MSDQHWGNHLGNISEVGDIAYAGGSLYYAATDFNASGLYRMDADGTYTQLDKRNGYCINVVDNKVYYMTGFPGDICVVSTSGGRPKTLVRDCMDNLFVSRSAMLYRKGNTVYMTNLSGQNRRQVATYVSHFVPHNGKIYFICYDPTGSGLYQVDPNESKPIRLTEEKPLELCSNGKNLYYSIPNPDDPFGKGGGKVYRIDENGETTLLPITDAVWNMNATDEYIFFRNQTEGGDLYRMNLDGANLTCLTQGNCVYIRVINDTVVFHFPTGYGDFPSGDYAIHQDGGDLAPWNDEETKREILK